MNITDTNNDDFNYKAFKHAIGMLESSGGKFLTNSTSSAAGKYHFLWNLIKDDDNLKGISKREFIGDPELQERIMDNALKGKLKGYPNYVKYATDLKNRYKSDLSISNIAALTHFLGAGNVKKYLTNPVDFRVSGKNMAPKEYLTRFNKYFNEFGRGKEKPEAIGDYRLGEIRQGLAEKALKVKDNTNVSLNNVNPNHVFNISNQQQDTGLEFHEMQHGGFLLQDNEEGLVRYESGGTHEQNSLGGIPQGIGANGKMNLVEEGETKWNNYVFSNSITI